MKKTILILIFILSLPLAYSIYGGESKVIDSFEKCLNLTINVNASSPIDKGEFSFLNCSEINRSHWFCNCSDNFNLTLMTKLNTLNNYTFNIVYYNYSEAIEEQTSSGSSGGGSSSSSSSKTTECIPYWKCTEWSSCQSNNRATRECTDINKCSKEKSEERICHYYVAKEKETTPIEEPTEEIELPFEEEKEETKKSWWLYIIIGLGLIIILCIVVFLYWYFYY